MLEVLSKRSWIQCDCSLQHWHRSAAVRSCRVSGLWCWAVLCTWALGGACGEQLGFGAPELWDVPSARGLRQIFPSNVLKLCGVCSAANSKGGDGWFLHGRTSKSSISTWVRSTMCEVWLPDISLVSQLSPWPADGVEYYFLKAKEIILPLFLTYNWSSTSSPVFFFPSLLLNCISSFLLHSSLLLCFFLCPLDFLINKFWSKEREAVTGGWGCPMCALLPLLERGRKL